METCTAVKLCEACTINNLILRGPNYRRSPIIREKYAPWTILVECKHIDILRSNRVAKIRTRKLFAKLQLWPKCEILSPQKISTLKKKKLLNAPFWMLSTSRNGRQRDCLAVAFAGVLGEARRWLVRHPCRLDRVPAEAEWRDELRRGHLGHPVQVSKQQPRVSALAQPEAACQGEGAGCLGREEGGRLHQGAAGGCPEVKARASPVSFPSRLGGSEGKCGPTNSKVVDSNPSQGGWWRLITVKALLNCMSKYPWVVVSTLL